jgi:hypothetical protein
VFSTGASAVTVRDSATDPTFSCIGRLMFWSVSRVAATVAELNPAALAKTL